MTAASLFTYDDLVGYIGILATKNIRKVSHTATIRDAALLMREHRLGALVVEQDGQPIGIVTETDLVRRVMADGLDQEITSVTLCMSAPLVTIEANKSPEEADSMMAHHWIRHLVVTEQGRIMGILSVRDLLIYYKNKVEKLAPE